MSSATDPRAYPDRPFVAVSALTVVVLLVVLARGRSHGLRGYAYALILAGAAGNLVGNRWRDFSLFC